MSVRIDCKKMLQEVRRNPRKKNYPLVAADTCVLSTLEQCACHSSVGVHYSRSTRRKIITRPRKGTQEVRNYETHSLSHAKFRSRNAVLFFRELNHMHPPIITSFNLRQVWDRKDRKSAIMTCGIERYTTFGNSHTSTTHRSSPINQTDATNAKTPLDLIKYLIPSTIKIMFNSIPNNPFSTFPFHDLVISQWASFCPLEKARSIRVRHLHFIDVPEVPI